MLYKNYFKRIIDLGFSIILLALTSPFFLVFSLLLFFANKGKVFFIQPRPGKGENIFHIIKFRTMNEKKDCKGEFLPDKDRITKLGRFIRNNSIDELPQLINIVKGDLSLIGPRPLLVEYLQHYNDFQKRRHEVRPGITGWAQVNGRNSLTWEKKFELDVYYVDNVSFQLDLKILYMTLINTIKGSNIYTSDGNTMEKFKGNC